jgi:hypothetical protein
MAQSERLRNPIHYIKMDIFKSIFGQVHFDYERYNGKKGAIEIGTGLYYPHPVLYSINRGISKQHPFPCAFVYNGLGIEIKRKFYFPRDNFNFYLAPGLSYKYKYLNSASVIVDGEKNSSYGIWYQVSRQMNVYGVFGSVGFITSLKRGVAMDVNIGAGWAYLTLNTTVDDFGKDKQHYYDMSGYNSYTELLAQLSVKFCLGFNGKKAI